MTSAIVDKIKRIESARTSLGKARQESEMASKPLLSDLHLMPHLYNVFKSVRGGELDITARKEFIFIALYLYSPSRFFGGKMPKGLRRAIGEATGTSCANVISKSCSELYVLYSVYTDFRENVEKVISLICDDATFGVSNLSARTDLGQT